MLFAVVVHAIIIVDNGKRLMRERWLTDRLARLKQSLLLLAYKIV